MIRNEELFSDNLPAGFDGVFDWDFLIPCFAPTKIEPTDIDFVVERHGKFLVIETKPVSKSMPLGQNIMYKELAKKDGFTVLVCYGKSLETINAVFQYCADGRQKVIGSDGECLRVFVREWFVSVNAY